MIVALPSNGPSPFLQDHQDGASDDETDPGHCIEIVMGHQPGSSGWGPFRTIRLGS